MISYNDYHKRDQMSQDIKFTSKINNLDGEGRQQDKSSADGQ